MKLIIGNRNYSSWSLRGWLAAKQSGVAFEELQVPILGDDWEQKQKEGGDTCKLADLHVRNPPSFICHRSTV